MTVRGFEPCPFCGSEPTLGKVRNGTREHPPLFGIYGDGTAASPSIDKEVMKAEVEQIMERIPNALRMLEDS